jgi:hypothetical protein
MGGLSPEHSLSGQTNNETNDLTFVAHFLKKALNNYKDLECSKEPPDGKIVLLPYITNQERNVNEKKVTFSDGSNVGILRRHASSGFWPG